MIFCTSMQIRKNEEGKTHESISTINLWQLALPVIFSIVCCYHHKKQASHCQQLLSHTLNRPVQLSTRHLLSGQNTTRNVQQDALYC